jgi:hypothetical protein
MTASPTHASRHGRSAATAGALASAVLAALLLAAPPAVATDAAEPGKPSGVRTTPREAGPYARLDRLMRQAEAAARQGQPFGKQLVALQAVQEEAARAAKRPMPQGSTGSYRAILLDEAFGTIALEIKSRFPDEPYTPEECSGMTNSLVVNFAPRANGPSGLPGAVRWLHDRVLDLCRAKP